jgi:hypothetical protein
MLVKPRDDQQISPTRLLEMLADRFGAFEAIANSSIKLARVAPEEELAMETLAVRGGPNVLVQFDRCCIRATLAPLCDLRIAADDGHLDGVEPAIVLLCPFGDCDCLTPQI